MALIELRSDLSQGGSTAPTGVTFATGTGADINILGTGLPALSAGDFFEVRDHSNSQNNGLYKVVTVTGSTTDYEVDKVNGLAPIVNAVGESVTTLGSTGTPKSVFFDTAGLGVYLLEQGNLSVDGVIGKALYSFIVQEWKDDNFLISNAPLPMLTIDSDAGKYIVGQDPSGNNNGWTFVDDVAGFSIRTRKLCRNMGWDEVDVNGNLVARYVGVVTLGAFEAPTTDFAYYQFGTDTLVDDTVNFDFAGPVNEAVSFYAEQAQTDLAITTTTITRVGGSFIDEGYKVGGQVTIRAAEDPANDGTHVLTGVSATVLTTTGLTANVDDTTARLSVNNDNAMVLKLRVRDGDPTGKIFAQADLGSAGKTLLGNFVYAFPLANSSDLKITATDGDMASAPYNGMSITYHSSGQVKTGLVGGSGTFGIVITGNNGTAKQVYEYVQYQLRQTTDIDADGDVAIGRTMDGLVAFVGDALKVGTTDGGLTFPLNPDGGGSGVFIDGLNAASKNDVTFYDNSNAARVFPETIAVTLDFNATLINDTVAEYDLFYDRTIRTAAASLTDLVISNATSKMTSAGSNLPNNAQIGVGAYVRVSGLTAANEPGNGVYQITAITTPTSDWTVVRYDGAAIPTTTTQAADLDQNCIDTPDNIIVHTDVTLTAATIAFAAPDTMTDTGNGLGIFASGDIVEVEGTTLNDGIYEVDTAAAGTITFIEQTIVLEALGSSFTVTKIVSGLASLDEVFSYDFDGNVQGGRSVSTPTSVKAKAVGAATAQYTESTVQLIETGTPLTIPVTSQQERNYA